MSVHGSSTGLWMLLVLGVATVTTGAPVWALLIGVASCFAAGGVAAGVMDISVLSAVSVRVLGLLDNDLLQALPLYVLVGVLLDRLRVVEALFATISKFTRKLGGSESLAALGVGVLISPMNGSVASTATLLSNMLGRRLGGFQPGRTVVLIAVAATVGVVVPPSLVLILMGDAMMRAHTEAANLAPAILGTQRIINTQDVFHAALIPAGIMVALWTAVAWFQGRKVQQPAMRPDRWQAVVAVLSTVAVVSLLAGVYSGHILAVEAAATGAVVLGVVALGTRRLSLKEGLDILDQSMGLTGALLALLVGATVFSLVFRLYATDVWLQQTVLQSSLPAPVTAAAVLLLVALCAAALDALEMIFVIIPVVAPPLVILLHDAQQAAVLLLLVLQLSFLLPPMGYAIVLARAATAERLPLSALACAMAPFVAVQVAIMGVVCVYAPLVHVLDAPTQSVVPMSEDDIDARMRAMSDLAPASDDAQAKPAVKNPE